MRMPERVTVTVDLAANPDVAHTDLEVQGCDLIKTEIENGHI